MKKILIIDNYDSFTWNLYQYFRELEEDVVIFQNDKINLDQIQEIKPKKIVLSPGPGSPKNSGISFQVVKKFFNKIPILGVCLGHQIIGEFFGSKIVRSKKIIHGKKVNLYHDGKGIFKKLPEKFSVVRYNSLTIDLVNIGKNLEVSAWTYYKSLEDKEIMGIRHVHFPIEGLQFHPESILSDYGKQIIKNFINL